MQDPVKKPMKKSLIVFFSLSAVAIILIGVAIAIFVAKNASKSVQTPDEATVATADSETVSATENSAESSATEAAEDESIASQTNTESTQTSSEEQTEAELTAPESLKNILAMNGMDVSTLSAYGCGQLVTVSSSGSSAQIGFYTMDNNQWKEDESLSCYGYVGRNGVTYDMHEGGLATPFGLYSISEAFYINDAPATGLPAFQITSDTYWVDDPDSKYYNRKVEGTSDKDWDSAEHMIDVSVGYEYGFVIDYNTAAEYNKGSAIFFHVSSGPTAGCVGTDRSSVLAYLAKLDASKNPYIIIV